MNAPQEPSPAAGNPYLCNRLPVSVRALLEDPEEQELYKCAAAAIVVEKEIRFEGEIRRRGAPRRHRSAKYAGKRDNL